jgi:RNA polymerase sigma-70 factor (sigma-E family)
MDENQGPRGQRDGRARRDDGGVTTPDSIDQTTAAELFATAYRVAFRILGSRDDAEDVAQEAVVTAMVRWRRVAPFATAWVVKVSTNKAIDVIRRRERDRSRPATGAERAAPTTDAWASERLDLAAALERLPKRQREVVVLRYVADRPEADVAQQLGCSVGSVKTHASRGLQALRGSMQIADESDIAEVER